MNEFSRLFRLRTFRRLLFAYGVCALGTWLGEAALAVLVLRQTGSPAAVAAIWVAGLFAPALLVPAVVARIECKPPRWSVAALLLGEAVLFALLAGLTSSFSLGLVLCLVALDGVAALAARALIKASLVATTTPAGLLREGNSVLVASSRPARPSAPSPPAPAWRSRRRRERLPWTRSSSAWRLSRSP